MYVVSVKKDNNYQPHSVYSDIQSMKLALMDIPIINKINSSYLNKLDHLNLNESNLLFDKEIKIDKVENRLTSEFALKHIKNHIDTRFEKLSKTPKDVCFPKEILDNTSKEFWKKLDKHNYETVIDHLQDYIKDKVKELQHKVTVKYGFMTENTSDYTVVKFTNSSKFRKKSNCFDIVISPETGYTTSLHI